ncbi:MAG: LLM class flavin-dependent oxidoreductase [Marinosulfonomonas sp.]|nr:LLM class flavin-dependent oxidoreductase [Marinosulfonomonas sp.]
MKFSMFHIAMGAGRESDLQVYDDFKEDILLADELGYDTFWLAEHHFNSDFSMSPSPNVLLGAVAAMTKNIKIGTSISVLPFHNPVRLAEEGAMLNLLSGGRYRWGIGRGITGHEFRSFGVDASESLERFREAHDLIMHAWKTGKLDWAGKYYNVPEDTNLAPAMMQDHFPDVWITAQSPSSVEWTAQHSYTAMQVAETIEAGKDQLALYKKAAKDAGVPNSSNGCIAPLRYIYVAETEKEAREKIAPQITEWWDSFTHIAAPQESNAPKQHQHSLVDPKSKVTGYEFWNDPKTSYKHKNAGLDFDGLNDAGIIAVGTAEQVIKLLEHQASELELEHMLCDFWRAGETKADRRKSMRLFGEKVIPYFK